MQCKSKTQVVSCQRLACLCDRPRLQSFISFTSTEALYLTRQVSVSCFEELHNNVSDLRFDLDSACSLVSRGDYLRCYSHAPMFIITPFLRTSKAHSLCFAAVEFADMDVHECRHFAVFSSQLPSHRLSASPSSQKS